MSDNAQLAAELAELVLNLVTVNPDVPDCIDRTGSPYQSAWMDGIVKRLQAANTRLQRPGAAGGNDGN